VAYIELPYGPPYKGLNSQAPAIFLDPSESPAMSNVWLRNQEIRSAPPFRFLFPGPEKTNPSLGETSFMDANNTIHTCAFTSTGLWQLATTNSVFGQNPWQFVGTPTLSQGIPVAARSFANILYYTNGVPYVLSWDGIASAPVIASGLTNAIFGGAGSSVGGVYLYEINNQICLLNVWLLNVSSVSNPIPGTGSITLPANSLTNFPQLLWYSANGLPNVWDPTVNTSAGFVNFLDVPDILTGVISLGEIAYIFRANGITQQTIGGSALQPFYFDHMWSSERGIGNVFPWSIAQFGSIGFFVATDNVYLMSINSFEPIGAGARSAIMTDLANATANPVASVVDRYASGFVYLRYELCIPLGTFTRVYSYSIEDKNWMVEDLDGVIVTGRPSVCWR
jgi:hypothetical protein